MALLRLESAGVGLGAMITVVVGVGLLQGQLVPRDTLRRDCSPGERLEWDGSAYQCRVFNDYRSTHIEWVDEYMYASAIGNGQGYGSLMSVFLTGTGATLSSNSGVSGRPGIVNFGTGTTTTGQIGLFSSSQALDFATLSSSTFEWVGWWGTLSTSGEEYGSIVGFGDSSSGVNMVDGCYFLYDRGNVATGGPNSGNADKLSCWCASNSTTTKYLMDGTTVSDGSFTTANAPIGAGSPPSTNVYNLKLVVTGTTKAEFYYNGTKACEIRTNIPSGSARMTGVMVYVVKSAGTTARTMTTDRTRLAIDLPAARTP